MNRNHHPSLENLRRSQINGSRSHPQLPSEKQEGTNHVRFESDLSGAESPLNFIADLVYGLAAIVCSMGLLTVFVLIYIIVRPFSVGMARRLSAQIGAAAFLDAIALLLPNTQIYLTGDSDVPNPVGTSILVSNHLMDADWFTILMLGRCVGLRGSVKMFMRNEILHLKQSNVERSQVRRNSPPTATRPSLASSSSSGMIDSRIRMIIPIIPLAFRSMGCMSGEEEGERERDIEKMVLKI